MAFKEDNYWGNRTPASTKQVRRAVSADNKSGLSDADLDALLKSLSNPNEAQRIGTAVAKPYVDDLSRRAVGTHSTLGMFNVSDMGRNHPFPSTPPVSDLVYHPTLNQAGADKLKGVANDIFGAIGDLAGGDASGGEDESPEAIYNRLRQAQGQYTYNGPSAHEMASKEFDPQFALLDQIKKQTTDRYSQNKQDIAGMYNALVNDQTAGRAQDAANFQKAGATVGQGYKQATDNLTGSATAYQQAMAKQLAALGINEGTGDVVAKVGQNLQDNVGRLNAQGANTQGMLASLGANEYAYDTNNIGLSKQAGINTQQQFMQQLNDALGQNDNQRLQLTGQMGQAENSYGMQIQQLLQRGQAASQDSLSSTLKAILDGNQQERDNYFKQAGLDLDLSKFNWSKDPTNPANINKDTTKLNPYDALSQRAAQSYGDPVKARQVVDEILSQYQQYSNPQSVGDFLAHIENQDQLKSDPNLTPLIYDFISKIMASQPKN